MNGCCSHIHSSTTAFSGSPIVARSTNVHRGVQGLPLKSGDDFWQLEKVADPLTGKKMLPVGQ